MYTRLYSLAGFCLKIIVLNQLYVGILADPPAGPTNLFCMIDALKTCSEEATEK